MMRRRSALAGLVAIISACAQEPDATDAADLGAATGPDAGPRADVNVEDWGTADALSLDGESIDAGRPAELVLPVKVALPYVAAGNGGVETVVTIENAGDADLDGLEIRLGSQGRFSLLDPPTSISARAEKSFTVRYEGGDEETIDTTVLSVRDGTNIQSIPVFAVVGDEALGPAIWDEVRGARGTRLGVGTTISLPTAPFPSSGAPYTDDRVRVFLPEAFEDLGAQSMVLHFHGFGATLSATLMAHRYQEQVHASGANVVLVVPQGPVSAQSGNFGKLMSPAGTEALLRQVLVLLYREGRISTPILGELFLTAHSGGYQAVAANLDPILPVRQIDLYDAIYGYRSTFEGFVADGGRLRSNYTSGGGTRDENRALAQALEGRGITVATEPTQRSLQEAPAVITFADSTHDGATRIGGAYGEWLRFGAAHGRQGPRLELRSVVAVGGIAEVRWRSPADDLVTGFVVEISADGTTWVPAVRVGPLEAGASFPMAAGARVRVRSEVNGTETLPSDSYRVDPGADILIVDHFDRTIGGGWAGLHHDFAAIVGESAGPVATIAHRAIEEDGFTLGPWGTVIWLLGDQSADDRTFSPGEQEAVAEYLAAGGSLIVSGSEVGYDLSAQGHGPTFLSATLGASYLADASNSYAVEGSGPLANIGAFTFGGATAPYAVGYPDVLGAPAGSTVLLRYASGAAAAVGVRGRTAVLGLPLETIDSASDRAMLTTALVAFVGP